MLATALVAERWTENATVADLPFSHVREMTAERKAYWRERDRICAGGLYYKPLKILEDLPGVLQPELMEIDEVQLPDSTVVVGVDISGKSYAFAIDAMMQAEDHIVNLMLNETPVSVTYCDLVDCVRVLKSDDKTPPPLRVGGLDVDNQLVFLFNEERYGQESTGLPLEDVPFTRTTLGDWKLRNPGTRIYIGQTQYPHASET